MRWVWALTALLAAAPAVAEPLILRSPDGHIALEIDTDAGGTPTWRVAFRGRELIAPSPLGLQFEQYRTGTVYHFLDTVTTVQGNHSLRFGGDIRLNHTKTGDEMVLSSPASNYEAGRRAAASG